ncbi:hypothetical protein GZ037_17810 [Klebsiella pneumoniae]|uniref:hypothetical protein n=1 Tax=Klebsiella pneumoniae TaxID=573 RepID=UPI00190EF86F|nr:hypothetical protein [Klebsiella pneumoniae]MBK0575607.1 hypothetical protein [Klebsiella pneumoniae]HBS7291978.1 hypothetical protein [Klebsiella pneumoniae]
MTGVLDETNDVFLNRITDITAKMSASVDTLLQLTDGEVKYFSEDNVKIIRDVIDDIARAASLILTDAINAASPEEPEKIQAHEPEKIYDEELMNKLPAVAVEVISQIGINSAMKLFKTFGGSTFSIGKGLRSLGAPRAKMLQEILTDEEIKKLSWYFSGTPVYFPRCNSVFREIKRREFLNELVIMNQNGTSTLMAMMLLCPKYEISDRAGWKWLKAEREAQSAQ